jgi:excisionase family DNA binding protein
MSTKEEVVVPQTEFPKASKSKKVTSQSCVQAQSSGDQVESGERGGSNTAGNNYGTSTSEANKRLLTIAQLGSRLGLSRDSVERLIRDGSLEAVDLRPRSSRRACWRVSEAQLEKFLLSRVNVRPLPLPSAKRRPRQSDVIRFIE